MRIDLRYLPVTLTASDGPISDKAFLAWCRKYDAFQLEATAEGDLLIQPMHAPSDDRRSQRLLIQLLTWATGDDRGQSYGCSAGFRLRNGALRSPDAAWVSHAAHDALTAEQQRGFLPLAPEFLVEFCFCGNRGRVEPKMQEYMESGCELAWLIDPKSGTVTIYRQNQPPVELVRPKEVHGEGPVAGFILDTTDILD